MSGELSTIIVGHDGMAETAHKIENLQPLEPGHQRRYDQIAAAAAVLLEQEKQLYADVQAQHGAGA